MESSPSGRSDGLPDNGMTCTKASDPTLASVQGENILKSGHSTSEEEFLKVLEDMEQICGEGDQAVPPYGETESSPLSAVIDFESDFICHEVTCSSQSDTSSPGENSRPLTTTITSGSIGAQGSPSPPAPPLGVSRGSSQNSPTNANPRRTRHGSANSNQSAVSFDSAIGDVYSVQTPPRSASFEFDSDLLEPGPSGKHSNAKVTSEVGGSLHHHHPPLDPPHRSFRREQQYLRTNRPRPSQQVSPYWDRGSCYSARQPAYPNHQVFPGQELNAFCQDLMFRFNSAYHISPRPKVQSWMNGPYSNDPLFITNRLLSDSLHRLRAFLFGLEPMQWLCPQDKGLLYNGNISLVAIVKAGATVDLGGIPEAYPLPLGENLEAKEAVHLLLAHDLYNELRSMIASLQEIPMSKEMPVMILTMLIAFFSPMPNLNAPAKVMQIRDFYLHKLAVLLNLHYGSPEQGQLQMKAIMQVVDQIKAFTVRLREFMRDVIGVGLHNQYMAVCENIGLMAFLIQNEPTTRPPNQSPEFDIPSRPCQVPFSLKY